MNRKGYFNIGKGTKKYKHRAVNGKKPEFLFYKKPIKVQAPKVNSGKELLKTGIYAGLGIALVGAGLKAFNSLTE